MSLVAAKNDLASMFTPPPSFDWADAVSGDDLKTLEKRFARYEHEAMQWRSTIAGHMQLGLEKLEGAVASLPKDEADRLIVGVVGNVLVALEGNIAVFSTPMHANPEIAGRVDQLSKLSTGTGKFVRKLLRRMEKVRVASYSACVDIYYGLLAFQSEHAEDREKGESFRDPAELGTFLRRLIA